LFDRLPVSQARPFEQIEGGVELAWSAV